MKKQLCALVFAVAVIAGLIEARGGGGHGGGHGGHGGHGRGGHGGHARHGGHGHGGRGYHHGGWGRGYGRGGYWGGGRGYWGGGYWPYYAGGIAIGTTAAVAASAPRNTFAFWTISNHTPGQLVITTAYGDYYLNSGETKTIDRTPNGIASMRADFNGQSLTGVNLYAPNITIDNDRGSIRISQY